MVKPKKRIAVWTVVLLMISGCQFKPGYKSVSKIPEASPGDYSFEEIVLKPENMFYIRMQERFEVFTYDIGDNESEMHNEAAVRLYQSVRRPDSVLDPNYLEKTSNIVEEKYLYLENYSSAKEGRVVFFKSAKYVNNARLKKYYSRGNHIELTTATKVVLGYWCEDPNTGIRHLLLTNGSRHYHVQTEHTDDYIKFVAISHPRHDAFSRERESDQLIPLYTVMETKEDSGLVYYRNLKADGNVQRPIKIEDSFEVGKITFKYHESDFKSTLSGKSYLTLDNGYAKGINKNSKAYIISATDRQYFKSNFRIIRKAPLIKKEKRMVKG